MVNLTELEEIAKRIRKKTFLMIYHGGSGHIAPSFSAIEIMVTLYYRIMNITKDNYLDDTRDRFILSKGHASAALYTILTDKGIINEKISNTFCQCGSILGGHPEKHLIPGVEMSTGSLGHGLSFGAGMAFAAKLDKKGYKVFTLLSDGECQEGSVWEGAMFASHHKLDNLIAIIDFNKLQSLGKTEEILSLNPFADKWRSFGWEVEEVDGHNISQLYNVLENMPFSKNKPSVIIAHTTKGKGISFMENTPIWHYRVPNEEELKIVRDELDISEDELKK